MVTIVLLNYNGWQDTIECLESLLKQTTREWRAVVADNGSEDDSLARLNHWVTIHNAEEQIHILPLEENYGFAKGNNKAIELEQNNRTYWKWKDGEEMLMRYEKADYYWILNNDTVVEPDCLEKMVRYMDTRKDITALTPAIRLYDQKDMLWNAGGKLVFGGRRYYGSLQPVSVLNGKKELPITFVTGCALMVRSELVAKKPLFTERFFFGEEDFEFSLRMKAAGKKMVCLTDAFIYHKVSATAGRNNNYNKLFIHLLNRSINLRLHYSTLKYAVWKMLYFPYVRYRFLRELNVEERNTFMMLLNQESRHNDCVSKALYEHYIRYSFHV